MAMMFLIADVIVVVIVGCVAALWRANSTKSFASTSFTFAIATSLMGGVLGAGVSIVLMGALGISSENLGGGAAAENVESALGLASVASNITCTWPPKRSVNAGVEPRYGTWTISTPAIILNSSPERWCVDPMPADAMLILPGLALA
jgi:hypothetical protein